MGSRTRSLLAGTFFLTAVSIAWSGGGLNNTLNPSQPVPVDITGDSSKVLVTNGTGQGLHLVDGLTGKANAISVLPTAGYGASLSADGSLVAFKSVTPGGPQSPALFNTATGETTLLATSNLAGTPSVSASGHVAYTVENELCVQGPDGSTVGKFDLGHHVNLVAISPDGSKVAFNNEADQIVVLNVQSGERNQVTDGAASYFDPVFSPNGKKVLLSTITGSVAVAKASGKGKVKVLGQGENPAWLDNSTVAFTSKTVVEGAGVAKTDVIAVKTTGKVKGVIATADGDATAVAEGFGVAMASLAPQDANLRSAGSNALEVGLTANGKTWLSPVAVSLGEAPVSAQPRAVVDTATTVYLSNVPYIHQNNDTPDWWNGNWSCNATAAIMAMQYYNTLPAHPMTASWPTPHNSDYGWYIPTQYSFNGHTYNKISYDPNGTVGRGGYGYITQNGWEDTKTHMAEYISYHGPSSAVDWSPTIAKARTEINNNHPFVLLTSITSSGHYPLVIGYVKSQHTLIFNDPYGNKNTGSYPSPDGRMVRYDWPGYNNGYSNLNIVHCYIWARDSAPPSPTTITVDNSSSNFTASSNWSTGTSAADKYGTNYRFRSTQAISDAATWNFNISTAGTYNIYAWWTQGSNRSASAPYILPDGTTSAENQQTGGGSWQILGTKSLTTGAKTVKLSCWTTTGFVVIADAVKLVKQ